MSLFTDLFQQTLTAEAKRVMEEAKKRMPFDSYVTVKEADAYRLSMIVPDGFIEMRRREDNGIWEIKRVRNPR